MASPNENRLFSGLDGPVRTNLGFLDNPNKFLTLGAVPNIFGKFRPYIRAKFAEIAIRPCHLFIMHAGPSLQYGRSIDPRSRNKDADQAQVIHSEIAKISVERAQLV